MECSEFKAHLLDYLDQTLSDDARALCAEHVKTCQNCRAEMQAMQLIISQASELEQVEAPDCLWQYIEAELDAAAHGRGRLAELRASLVASWQKVTSIFENAVPTPVVQIAGLAAILIIGIVIGRYVWPERKTPPGRIAADQGGANYQMINARTQEYIERSKILFLGIVNSEAESYGTYDFGTEKRIANHLVREASFIKESLPQKRNERIRELVSDLQMILMEIANMEEQHDFKDIELIKSGINRKDLLLKINLYDISEEKIQPDPEPKHSY